MQPLHPPRVRVRRRRRIRAGHRRRIPARLVTLARMRRLRSGSDAPPPPHNCCVIDNNCWVIHSLSCRAGGGALLGSGLTRTLPPNTYYYATVIDAKRAR
eukprot:3135503-Pyramimonas_sp.AAC.1